MSDNDYGRNTVLAFLLGGAVGAAIALLYSPGSGEENRRKLRKMKDDAVSGARERAEHARETVNEAIGKGRETVHEAIEKGREFVHEQKGAVASAIDAGREAFERERHKNAEKS